LVSQLGASPFLGLVLMMAFIGSNLYTHIPPFWAIPTLFLGSTAAASAIGFINMVGNFGGSVGPRIVGKAAEQNDFATGLLRIGPFPFVAAAIVLAIGFARRPNHPKN
jgi:ACS family tartrate transporter-like MFS transporter